MRKNIIRNYIQTDQIYSIIGHDTWVYVKIFLVYGLSLIVLTVTYLGIIQVLQQPFLSTLRAILGVGMYLKMVYDFFDEYLDSLVITDKWLVHFRREWLRSQKTEMLSRVSIESISHEQNSFWDTLLSKGDLKIKLEDTITRFDDIWDPAKTTDTLLDYRDKILGRHNYMENEVKHEPDKYNILVEALWEVVNEYVEKKKWDTSGWYY